MKEVRRLKLPEKVKIKDRTYVQDHNNTMRFRMGTKINTSNSIIVKVIPKETEVHMLAYYYIFTDFT